MNNTPETLEELRQELQALKQEYHAKTRLPPWWLVLPGIASILCIVFAAVVIGISIFAEPAHIYTLSLAACFIGYIIFDDICENRARHFFYMKEDYRDQIDRLTDRIARFCPENNKESE